MKLIRQTVDEKIRPILNYIFKFNLAEEGDRGGEGDHAEGGQYLTQSESVSLTEKENHF
jgi:hypothetical protein